MIVAITDRRLMGDGSIDAFAAAVAKVRADIVQVREKDLDGAALLAYVRAAIATGARVMVNDRIDIALAARAYGVHLPERGMAIADVRAIAPQLAIGVSRHTIEGVRAAAGADLIQLGPIWRTPGKGEPLGPLALEGARAVTHAKLIAVGGVETPDRVRAALRAGADGVAAIRAAWSGALAR